MRFSYLLRHISHRVVSRLSLAAMLSLSVGATLLTDSPASAAEQVAAATPKTFVARDATRYRENPNLTKYGMKNIIVAYEGSLWPSGADRTQPDTTFIAKNYIPKIRGSNPDVVVIDIERWVFTSAMTATQVTDNINKYRKVIAVFRREMPKTKIGFYVMLPERNWNAPCGDSRKVVSRTAAWKKRNLRLQPLADAVDIIFPSVYTFYVDTKSVACWPAYAKANLELAKTFGKPVWAFLYPKDRITNTRIETSFWRKQLETVYQYADGVVIWSAAAGSEKWSWTAPWWVETAAFLKAKGLAQ